MRPFVYVFSTSLAICALGACSPKPETPGEVTGAGESPAATMTADEASAYLATSSVADHQDAQSQ